VVAVAAAQGLGMAPPGEAPVFRREGLAVASLLPSLVVRFRVAAAARERLEAQADKHSEAAREGRVRRGRPARRVPRRAQELAVPVLRGRSLPVVVAARAISVVVAAAPSSLGPVAEGVLISARL
jgi:hypothetical protein